MTWLGLGKMGEGDAVRREKKSKKIARMDGRKEGWRVGGFLEKGIKI